MIQCVIETGKRQLLSERNHHYTSGSSAQLNPPLYSSRYFGTIPSRRYPAQLSYRESEQATTGGRFRIDPRFLKGKIEVKFFFRLQ